MQIEIDFDVFKSLTSLRRSESHSFSDVIRELLKLPASTTDGGASRASQAAGRVLGKRFLPDGTELRATYKHRLYKLHIEGGQLVNDEGRVFSSASSAASVVTKTSVNGLNFWEVRRPGDVSWTKLSALPKA